MVYKMDVVLGYYGKLIFLQTTLFLSLELLSALLRMRLKMLSVFRIDAHGY